MRIGYLVNMYPRTSHSFIRREIEAVEAAGDEVTRYSVRPLDEDLVNEADRREAARTQVVLDAGVARHVWAVVLLALTRPAKLARAFVLAFRMGWGSDRGLLRHFAYLAEAAVLAAWLRRDRVEHLHAHFGTNPAAVAAICSLLGGPAFSFTVHGSEFEKPHLLALGEKIRLAAFVVAISSYGRAQLYKCARDQDWSKIHVVRCGLRDDLLGATAAPLPSAPRLVCVARLVRLKGHAILLDAAARLVEEGVPFEIVLAGDGPYRPQVVKMIAERGLQDRVRLTGWLDSDQIRGEILASRAMVLPSLSEGLPVVLMESLALGRPTIATAISGIPELVEDGVNGWLVPAGSAEALAVAMRQALEASPATIDAMGRKGASIVAERHDAAREASRLRSLFRSRGSLSTPVGPDPDGGSASSPGTRPTDRIA